MPGLQQLSPMPYLRAAPLEVLCSCGVNPSSNSKPGLRWSCPNNLHYGLHMGAMFTDTPMKAKRSRPQASTLMHHHNSELGRKVTLAYLF